MTTPKGPARCKTRFGVEAKNAAGPLNGYRNFFQARTLGEMKNLWLLLTLII